MSNDDIEKAIALLLAVKAGETLSRDAKLWLKDFAQRMNVRSQTSLDFPRDYSFECSMCGKPMEYRFCGMCTSCEQVWNG